LGSAAAAAAERVVGERVVRGRCTARHGRVGGCTGSRGQRGPEVREVGGGGGESDGVVLPYNTADSFCA